MVDAKQAPWAEKASRAALTAKAIVLVLVVIAVVYPFLNVLSTSLANDQDVNANGGLVLIPLHPSLEAYRTIFNGGAITRAIWVSVGVTLCGTILSLVVTATLAYALSRPILAGRPILFLALFSLLFPPGIIPQYLVVKQLGLLNNYASLILPVLLNAFNFIVLRQFFTDVPQELLDAAHIDGASDWRIFLRVVLPLSKPAIAVVSLFYAVSYWNAFFQALLYLSNNSQWPLQLVLRLYVLQGSSLAGAVTYSSGAAPPPTQALQMAVVVIATIPILLVYPFLQRYFTRGVLTGAIKG